MYSTLVAFSWKQDKYVKRKIKTIAEMQEEQELWSAGQMPSHRVRKY